MDSGTAESPVRSDAAWNWRPPRTLAYVLAVAFVLLTVTVVPGIFTIDEMHQIVLVQSMREGRVSVANTAGLHPSRELLYFDPTGTSRVVATTPVTPTIPPLHAVLGIPFSFLGWRGLVAINTFAFLATTWMVFVYVRRHAQHPDAPWMAALTYALCSYNIEYAQGVWPHLLATSLTTGAFLAAARVRDGSAISLAFAAGLLAGAATGVRYQNIVFAAAVGAGILLLAPRRVSNSVAYAAGVLIPLAFCSLVNHNRIGSWNPISKGGAYLQVSTAVSQELDILRVLRMLATLLVDYSYWEVPRGRLAWMTRAPDSGIVLQFLTVKKAWIQSCPWIVASLLFLVGAASTRRFASLSDRRRELLAIALPIVAALATFAVAGLNRHDGFCYNQRYFLELVPLVAVALAWGTESMLGRRDLILVGALGALLIGAAATIALPPGDALRIVAIAYLPQILAVVLLVSFAIRRLGHGDDLATIALGLCLGWALVVHLGDDVRASRSFRARNFERTQQLSRVIPDHSAVFAYWGNKDYVGPLQLSRDVVILDLHADMGKDAPRLMDQLIAAKRRVFLLTNGMSEKWVLSLIQGRAFRQVPNLPFHVLEIADKSAAERRT